MRPRRFTPVLLLVIALLGLLSLVGMVGTARAQPSASPTALQASDWFRVRTIQDVTLSPNGRNVAYTVRRATAEGVSARTQLYVAPVSGRTPPRRLTRTPAGATQPDWGPDGRRIAFVRPVDGVPQVFLISLEGGEPYQLTAAPHGARHPVWGPRGEHLLFSSSVPRSLVSRQSRRVVPSVRPGRTPADTIRTVPPDTLLVLRHATTLDPVDTLSLGPEGPSALADTAGMLRTPTGPNLPDAARRIPVDTLRSLPPDTVHALFERAHLRPDTTTVPVPPDTAATPDGDLLQLRRWLDQPRPEAPTVYGAHTAATPTGRNRPTYRHHFVVSVPPGIRQGTPPRPQSRRVTQGFRSYGAPAWLPGSGQIVVSAPAPSDSAAGHNLYLVDVEGNPRGDRTHRLLHLQDHTLLGPHVTSDGTTVAFRLRATDAPSYAQTNVGLFALDGRSDPQIITGDVDRDISALRWSPDGWFLYATASQDTGHPLYRFAPFARSDTTEKRTRAALETDRGRSRDVFTVDSSMVRTARHQRMTDATRWIRDFDATDATVIYAAADADTPSELFANTVSFENERRLSSHNEWLERRRLADTRHLSVPHGDTALVGRLTRPVPFGDSLRHPLVVVPRGGPSLLDRPSPFRAWFERQYLAARGLTVAEAWPRGSVGQGNADHRIKPQDWSAGSMSDVLAVADSVAGRTRVDSSRQGVAGHGYGATLATWMTAYTDRFRAAVAQNGIYDLSSLRLHDETAPLLHDYFGLPLADSSRPPQPELPRASSRAAGTNVPLRPDSSSAPDATLPARAALHQSSPSSYASWMETPLLLIDGPSSLHGEDPSARVLYHRLRARERPVEYVHYTGDQTPAQERDQLVRLYEFLARFLVPSSPSSSE